MSSKRLAFHIPPELRISRRAMRLADPLDFHSTCLRAPYPSCIHVKSAPGH